MASLLRMKAEEVFGVDYRADRIARGSLRAVAAAGEQLPFRPGTFALVAALDVLEHTDDAAVVEEVRRVLVPGGVFLISVPAAPGLWSFRDIGAGHRRRYRRSTLLRLLTDCGFDIQRVRYFQSLLFPLFVLSRLIGGLSGRTRRLEERPGRLLNRALLALSLFDTKINRILRLPWGSSMLVIAVRT